jgi:curved DNA-binding protein CbpA
MRLDQGLFKFDFEDHHAVLGLPIDADPKVVRKRYLQIARKLHPDSLGKATPNETQRASEVLSKWVNPAYEVLRQEKTASEHALVLKLKGQSLGQSNVPPEVTSQEAQELLRAAHIDMAYKQAVKTLSEQQFDQLEKVADMIGQLSELNLVYLYRTGGGQQNGTSSSSQRAANPPAAASTAKGSPPGQPTPPPPRRNRNAILESYIKRAQEFELDKNYSASILELREALKTYPNSVECHSYLAVLYLKSGQNTMARIHAKRALDINPNDEKAQAVQNRVEKQSKSAPQGGERPQESGKNKGGFFGLFGGKKK